MAFEYQGFATLGVNLNRQKYGPLDISNVFTSENDLKYYLTKGTHTEGVSEYWYKSASEKVVPYPYEGQVLATVIDGVVNVYTLSLDADGSFQTQEIAGKIEVDGKTIVKDADGKLSVVAPVNPDEKKTYNFSYANGVYSWVEVDTATAAGQAQAIQGLTDRTVALETAINGKPESAEGANDAVVGLVTKVAELADAGFVTENDVDTIIAKLIKAADPVDGKTIENIQSLVQYVDENAGDITELLTATDANTSKLDGITTTVVDYVTGQLASVVIPKESEEVSVAEDGTLGIKNISTDKLVQGTEPLVLYGGNAEVAKEAE